MSLTSKLLAQGRDGRLQSRDLVRTLALRSHQPLQLLVEAPGALIRLPARTDLLIGFEGKFAVPRDGPQRRPRDFQEAKIVHV